MWDFLTFLGGSIFHLDVWCACKGKKYYFFYQFTYPHPPQNFPLLSNTDYYLTQILRCDIYKVLGGNSGVGDMPWPHVCLPCQLSRIGSVCVCVCVCVCVWGGIYGGYILHHFNGTELDGACDVVSLDVCEWLRAKGLCMGKMREVYERSGIFTVDDFVVFFLTVNVVCCLWVAMWQVWLIHHSFISNHDCWYG